MIGSFKSWASYILKLIGHGWSHIIEKVGFERVKLARRALQEEEISRARTLIYENTLHVLGTVKRPVW